jgi:drug/metabolite transporter (DMT)-like permease
MILLVPALFFTTLFGQVQKLAIFKKCDFWMVGLVNYLFAAALSGLWGLFGEAISFTPKVLWAGALGGVSFAASLITLFWGIRVGGLSLSFSVSRLSILVPTVLSVFIWKEIPTALQIAGIGVICVALVLLSFSRANPGNGNAGWSLPLVLVIFVLSGASLTASKLVHELGLDRQKMTYLLILFFIASLPCGAVYLFRPPLFKKLDISIGLLLGGCNFLGTWSMLEALERIKGVIFFPAFSSAGLAISSILAFLIWKEKLDGRGIVGIALTMAALFLVSL